MIKFLLGFLFLFFCHIAKAQPEILGSHISYKAIDSVTYEVKLTVIRECSGNANAIKNTIEMRFGTYSVYQQPNLISISDITPIGKNCTEKSKCAGGKLYGFIEMVYTTTFKLDSVKECDVYFSWYGGNRYTYLSTVSSIENHYNYAYLNYCASKINTSPVFTNTPRIISFAGQNSQVAIRAIDTVEINDSIVYEFNSPLTDTFTKLKYTSVYNNEQFLTYLGAFRSDLKYPAGLFLDNITGNLSFRAMKNGEKTPYCIEANEYRNINGTVEKIGTIRWDMTFIILSSPNNKIPTNITVFDFVNPIDEFLCGGIVNKFSFESFDPDTTDSAHFKLDFSGYKNISFADSFLNKDQSVYLNWKPNNAQLRNINSPYLITMTVEDDNCDYNGNNSINFPFYFDDKNSPNFNLKDSLFCLGNDALLRLNLSNPDKVKSIIWNDTSAMDTFKISQNNIPTSVKIKVMDTIGCSIEKIKNIGNYPAFNVQFSLRDSLFCKNTDANLSLNITNDSLVKNIIWNDEFIQDTFEIASNKIPQNIEIKVTDINGCAETKTQFVDHFKRTLVSLNFKDSACFNDSTIQLNASIKNGIWAGNTVKDSVFYPNLAKEIHNKIRYYFTDKNDCKDSAFKNIFIVKVPAPKININPATGVVPLTVKLSEISNTKYDTYFWVIKNTNDSILYSQKNATALINKEGIYDVKLTVNMDGCSNFIIEKNAINALKNNAGIFSKASQNFGVFPNPVEDELFIKYPKEYNEINYKILDINGKVILEGNVQNNQNSIKTENLKSGFYFIEISNQENVLSKIKFVKY